MHRRTPASGDTVRVGLRLARLAAEDPRQRTTGVRDRAAEDRTRRKDLREGGALIRLHSLIPLFPTGLSIFR